jgi:hypothetical protein
LIAVPMGHSIDPDSCACDWMTDIHRFDWQSMIWVEPESRVFQESCGRGILPRNCSARNNWSLTNSWDGVLVTSLYLGLELNEHRSIPFNSSIR